LITEELVKKYKPQKVILFGSTARGDANDESDIDLLVIKTSREKRPYRIQKVFMSIRNIKRQFPLDVIVYTPSEIKKRISLGDYFIKNVLAEGQVLYE